MALRCTNKLKLSPNKGNVRDITIELRIKGYTMEELWELDDYFHAKGLPSTQLSQAVCRELRMRANGRYY